MESLTNYFKTVFGASNYPTTEDVEHKPGNLRPDKHSKNPDLAWSKRQKRQHVQKLTPLRPGAPIREDRVRFVCISDTHTKVERGGVLDIPPGDVLLHAGDMTMFGQPEEVDLVNKYMGTLPHKHKIVIAGNHDMTFDPEVITNKTIRSFFQYPSTRAYRDDLEKYGVASVQEMLTNCTYLKDSMVKIYGIKIYGSPWTAGHGAWGFQRERGHQLTAIWNAVPDDTDILLTHMPPLGYGDSLHEGKSTRNKLKSLFGLEDHVGCVDLLNTVQTRVKPAYHVYGHIHEGYGVCTDGTTTFINASTCNESYNPINPPIVFDVMLPSGVTKSNFGEEVMEWVIPTSKDADGFEVLSDHVADDNNKKAREDECDDGIEFVDAD